MTTPASDVQDLSPRIFVMGASGNVGGEIARQLSATGASFRVGVRDPDSVQFPEPVEVVRFDASDPRTFAALDGVQQMFLLWPPGTQVRRDLLPMLAHAKSSGVRQVVFLSILGADRIGVLPHRTVERWLETSDLDWVFLRASYFMQNLSGVHRDDIRLRHDLFLPAGQGKTSFVDVRDVAAVGVQALLKGDRQVTYDLTGGAALDYVEVASTLSVTLGRPVTYTNPSPWRFVRVSRARGVKTTFALFMLAEYTVARLGLAARVTGDVRRVLGREPITLRKFAEDHRETWL